MTIILAWQNAHVYQINPGARWYYEWESAATKAQRFTKHVLRVYVFERLQAVGGQTLRVVAIATSPEFLVVSYRRAPTEGRADRREGTPQGVEWTGIPVNDIRQGSSVHSDQQYHSVKPISVSERVFSGLASGSDDQEVAYGDFHADQKAWGALNEETMLTSKHLAVLFHFIAHVDANQFRSCLLQWSGLLFDTIEDEHPQQKHLPSSIWYILHPTPTNESEDLKQDPTARVVSECTRVVGRLMFDCTTTRRLHDIMARTAGGLLDKRALRAGYIQAVEFARQSVERTMSPVSSRDASLAELAEEIVTVVFQDETFTALRPIVMEVLVAQSMFGFQSFVAQVRAMFVARTMPQNSPITQHGLSGLCASPFEGKWNFDGARSSIKTSAAAGFSLCCAMHFLREWAQVSIQVLGDQSIAMMSTWASRSGLATSASDAMVITLDGRRRLFRNFPSGLSSMIPFGCRGYGEYRGQVESATNFWIEFSTSVSDPSARSDFKTEFRWTAQFQAEDIDSTSGLARTIAIATTIEPPEGGYLQLRDKGAMPPQASFQLNFVYNRR